MVEVVSVAHTVIVWVAAPAFRYTQLNELAVLVSRYSVRESSPWESVNVCCWSLLQNVTLSLSFPGEDGFEGWGFWLMELMGTTCPSRVTHTWIVPWASLNVVSPAVVTEV